MSKPTSVEIVASRHKGVTGYAGIGRSTFLGNPYAVGQRYETYRGAQGVRWGKVRDAAHAVELYRLLFSGCTGRQSEARKLLTRDWPDGVVRIACPCNGALKGEACHATVVKEFLEREIAERGERHV